MAQKGKSADRQKTPSSDQFLAEHPVFRLEAWAEALGGPSQMQKARERARYHHRVGRLLRLGRSLYAVVPPGTPGERFTPDPYLVAGVLRRDSILSHHTALDLHGVSRSLFTSYPYLTTGSRRHLRFRGNLWPALKHPAALTKGHRTSFGIVRMDRLGVILRVTGPERTLVDGFMNLRWVGGLEELVESAAAFHDLDLDKVEEYLRLFKRRILYAAVGWFLEKHPRTAQVHSRLLERLEKNRPATPVYLGGRAAGGRLQARWRLLVPEHLALGAGFEGAGERR